MNTRTTPSIVRRSVRAACVLAPVAAAVACGSSDGTVEPTSATGSSTSDTSSTAATGTGGTGGSGGAGTGGATSATSGPGICTPNEVVGCYDGPAGTENVGSCKGGMKTCNADGTAFGDCVGQVVPAEDVCGNMADEDCDGTVDACNGNYLWAKRYGDIDFQKATAVALDASDNIFVTGKFRGKLDLGKGELSGAGLMSDDVFVAKLDASGNTVWSAAFGDDKDQVANGIAADLEGNTIVTGEFKGGINFGAGTLNSTTIKTTDIFLAKFDSTGKLSWAKSFGASGADAGRAVTTDANGNIIVTGSFTGSVNFGNGPTTAGGGNDLFVAKYDPSGILLWVGAYGNSLSQIGHAIAVDANGNVGVTGGFAGSMNFPLLTPPSITALGTDIFVALFDANGVPLWARKYGDDTLVQEGRGIAFAPKGEFYLVADGAGATKFDTNGQLVAAGGKLDAMVAKFSAWDGVVPPSAQWSQRFGDSLHQYANGVSVDGDGNVVIVGAVEGTTNFGGGMLMSAGKTDAYAAKFNSLGNHVWSKLFGNVLDQTVTAVAATTSGTVLVGAFQGLIDFGGGELSNADPMKTFDDMFIAKLSP